MEDGVAVEMKLDAHERTFMAIDDKILYQALCNDNNAVVVDLCSKAADGPLHYCTMHHSTVLHMACYFKKWNLANILFDSLSEKHLSILTERKNEWGDTVLHDVATSNSVEAVKLAEKMLRTKPELLTKRNKAGETCVFRATRYGKKKMFDFLAQKLDVVCAKTELDHLFFFQRTDKTTILHVAILTRKYDLALMIAKKYQVLHQLKVHNKWTALQLLACSPAAFESGARLGKRKKLLYSRVSIDEQGNEEEVGLTDGQKQRKEVSLTDEQKQGIEVGLISKALEFITSICKYCCSLPMIDEVRKMKKGHKDALQLAIILIEQDSSWEHTHKPSAEGIPDIVGIQYFDGEPREESTTSRKPSREENDNGRHDHHDTERGDEPKEEDTTRTKSPGESSKKGKEKKNGEKEEKEYESEILDSDEAPLLMAARKGCIEIVREILKQYPQAVHYLNGNQENLLHVAIKTRNIEIFNYVEKNIPFLRGQLRALDDNNNSILHMVGCPRKERLDRKVKSPVLQLSEELWLLQSLKNKCPSYLQYHRNNNMRTADELFAKENEDLRKEAKEWLRKTAEHSTVVIILIATVAFAAAYTVPGGPDEQTGYPVLLTQPFFLVFTLTDVLSLGFALTAVVVFLSIITSSCQLEDFRKSLPRKLFLGFTLLFLSVTMMMVAFAATIILMANDKRRWTKIALYVVAFFPICIFMLSYIAIYIKLGESMRDWIVGLGKSLPCRSRVIRICKSLPRPSCLLLKNKKSLASTSSQPSSSHTSSKRV